MDISGLLTSAGINIGVCLVFLSLYSVLRKQPSNASVYFGQRLAQLRSNGRDHFSFDRFVPSPRWILKAWQASEEEILACGGLDAVAFLRIVVFSRRIFSIAALICIPLVLPLNYFGKEMKHRNIPSVSLDVFTIGNIREGSKWLGVHCLALYIISCAACVLLYFEYKNIAKMRLEHIVGSSLNPSYFTIIVRAIPSSPEESYSDSVRNFFTSYHASSYLSHQMVYRSGTAQKLMIYLFYLYQSFYGHKIFKVVGFRPLGDSMYESNINMVQIMMEMINDASKMIKCTSTEKLGTYLKSCGLSGGIAHSFKVLSSKPESVKSRNDVADPDSRDKECVAALVFFKTRYAALVASQVLQSANPMSWVTDLAPEPHDVYWKNLSIPYRQLWVRRIAILLASIGLMILFIIPVTFVQGLLLLEQVQKRFPFLREVLRNKFMVRLITGYLPSLVLMLFLLAIPPTMMLFSTIEGPLSRSGRKKSACYKVLYFLIWNVFFVYVLSANIIERLDIVSRPKVMTAQLAATVPRQATFFMTYVMTSGWASLASEIMQPYALVCNFFFKYIFRKKDDPSNGTLSFPYHTEIPRVLLFGFIGFTYSLLAPLILPFLLVYFFLTSLVYRNQILNVYVMKYQSGGQYWPMMHNTAIFSLVLTQVIAIGVFGLKRSPVAAAFTIPLVIFTLLFNEYCRQRFHPVFKDNAAQVLIDMDLRDEQCGNIEVIHKQLPSAYCQFASTSNDLRKSVSLNPCNDVSLNPCNDDEDVSICIPEESNPGSKPTQGNESRGPSSMEIEEPK